MLKVGHLARLATSGRLAGSSFISARTSGYHDYVAEPAHPIPGRKPKVTSAEEALSLIKSGQSIFLHSMAATPRTAITKLTEKIASGEIKDLKIHNIIIDGEAEYGRPEFSTLVRSNSMFCGGSLRQTINEGRGDFTPVFLQDVPKIFDRGIVKLDACVVQVTPVDKHGYHSLGPSVDATRAAIRNSKVLIGQINSNLPRTQGDAMVHQSHFDAMFEGNEPMSELPIKSLSDDEKKIGKIIADNLVSDGATLQMGIGGIPDAVLSQLTNHKDLGIHSEMFSDGVVDLVKLGAVTNSKKNIERGKIVATFCIGTKKLFDFMDDNPFITMRTCDYVNRESIVTQNPKVTAINSCIEIDIVGNVIADSIGTKVFSGFGGQVDFLRGAAMCHDGLGKPILAIQSQTAKGKSKISVGIPAGSSVTSTRAHVHYVVTENGIAELFGRNYRQRAHALIKIAHPNHQESLEKQAFERLGCMPSAD